MKRLPVLIFLLLPLSLLGQNKAYSIVFLNKKEDAVKLSKAETTKIMEGHLANINRLAKEGKLLAAGPFQGGGGLFILNTESTDEAQRWIDTDPGIQAKRWNIEILPYKPRHGGVCPVQEPYEMVTYSFIRYDAIVSKFTANNYPEIMKRHNEYLQQLTQTGNVITEAAFGEHDGGILVMQGEVQQDVIEKDPGIVEGLIQHQPKKLYIAKGSFCE